MASRCSLDAEFDGADDGAKCASKEWSCQRESSEQALHGGEMERLDKKEQCRVLEAVAQVSRLSSLVRPRGTRSHRHGVTGRGG